MKCQAEVYTSMKNDFKYFSLQYFTMSKIYIFRDGKGIFHTPDYPYLEKYINLNLKIGWAILRFMGLEKNSPYRTPFGYYKGKSYFPSLADFEIKHEWDCVLNLYCVTRKK